MHARRGLGLACLAALLAGCTSPAFTEVSNTPLSAHEPSLAAFADGFTVAWYDTRDGHGEIYARAVNPDGTAGGPEHQLTTGQNDAYEADVHALGATDFVVGWYEKTKEAALLPRLGRWSRSGQERWVITLAPAGRNTVVRVDGRLIFVAWVQNEAPDRAGVWAGWWTDEGLPAISARRVADAGPTTWNLNAAVAPSSAPEAPVGWVVFDAKAGTRAEELFAVEVGRAEASVTRLTDDDGVSSKYPDVALSGTRLAVTWFDTLNGNEDIYLVVGRSDQLRRRDALTAAGPTRVTATAGHSIGAYLTWNGDRVGLAWCDDTEGQHEVYLESFDASGQPLGPAQRLTNTAAASLIPAIEPWGQGFALAWSEWTSGTEEHGGGGTGQVALQVVPR